MPKGWIGSMPRGGRRGVRTLTNNPNGGGNWGGFSPMGFAKRGMRRLMKVDPANAQGTPDSQLLTGTHGVAGKTGARGAAVMGSTESRTTGSGSGTKNIRDRGTNRRLKKR